MFRVDSPAAVSSFAMAPFPLVCVLVWSVSMLVMCPFLVLDM
jgi:hypothetical protein